MKAFPLLVPRLARAMSRRLRARVGLLLPLVLLGLLAPALAKAAEDAPNWRIEKQVWSAPMAPGGAVSIDNPRGDVRLRAVGLEPLAATAQVQSALDDPSTLALYAEPSHGGFALGVRGDGVPAGPPRRRADLTVYVPAGSPVSVRTVDGLIEAKNLMATLEARSQSGSMVLVLRGPAQASTGSGNLTVSLGIVAKELADASSRLETALGDIEIFVAPTNDVRIEILSAREVHTGRGLQVRRPPAASKAQMIVAAGAGTRLVEIVAPEGAVSIHLL